MNNILRIDVGAPGKPSITVQPVGRYATLGGRGMTSTVIWEEVDPKCDPLGPENKLVISPGIMSGSTATTSGRLSIGCKSPLTGGIKESNSGGQASQYLARLGYAAVIIEGKRRGKGLYKVVIDNEGVSVVPCDELKGLGNYAVVDAIEAVHGNKVALFCIGPAGEYLLANSTVALTDPDFRPTRHAARGGVGAVMGSKGIKAIVVDGKGAPLRQPADPEGFKKANKKLIETLKSSEGTGEILPAFGTASTGDLINEVGAYPALNCSQGQYEDMEAISGRALAALENDRGGKGAATHGCHSGCVIQCSGTFSDRQGKFVTKQPEYETVWSHGGNCGISDLDAIAKMDRMDDDLGLDTIDMGCTIGVLMEAGELEFGDAEGAIALIEEIGKGTEKGRLLGSGTATVAKHYGVKRAPVVKGQAISAYDPRGLKGMGVTYATSPMGADHTAGYTLANHFYNVEPVSDPLSAEGQLLPSAIAQISTAALDATGYCLFVGMASIDKPEMTKYMLGSLSTFTGFNFTETSFAALGIRILRMELDFNRRAGFTAEDDRLPEWMTTEPLAPHNTVFDVPNEVLDKVHDHFGVMLAMMPGIDMAFSPPIALFGAGAHTMLPDNLSALGVKKPLIVTDQGVVKVGLVKIVTDVFDAKFMDYAIYDGTEPNPTIHNVNAALAIYRDQGCDGLISIGGGSPHDCCKAIGVLVNNPGTINDYAGLFAVINPLPPLVAITTTSGTGSEATPVAVITDPERHDKMALTDAKLLPIIAVNDPLLTQTMPSFITASTAMDALTHAAEALISNRANPFSDGLALQAIRLIVANLPKAYLDGNDMEARSNMCYGQYSAGLAFSSASLGNTHSLAHALGAVYNLPHGDCNALLLPHVLRKNKSACLDKLVEMAQAMGEDITGLSIEAAADKAITAVEALNMKVGINTTLTELAKRCGKEVNTVDIPEIVEHALKDPCCVTNPLTYSSEDFKELCRTVWGG